MRAVGRAALALAIALAWIQPASAQSASLAAVGADPVKVSASGLSSGAFMAVQYGVAFSSETMGVGVVAGGPFNCAIVTPGSFAACMQGAPSGADSYKSAKHLAAQGLIDPVKNLKSQRLYLFRATHDEVVAQPVMDAVRDFYKRAGAPAANVQYVTGVPAGHAFISPTVGPPCPVTAPPFVEQCDLNGAEYDQPGAILTQVYGPLQPKAGAALSAGPMAFNQLEFASLLSGLATTGYVYVPAPCTTPGAKCAVHVVFHGCSQSADMVSDIVYRQLGYNAWADTNHIIVLYPQVNPTWIPFNPMGCWDWWGYSGLNFPTRSGAQLTAVRAMVHRLLASPPPP